MKKRLIAIIITISVILCVFPTCAFADARQTFGINTNIDDLGRMLWFKYSDGTVYYVDSEVLVSYGSSYTGYVIVIQEVLDGLYQYTGNNNINPHGIDGGFGENTRLAVVSFQVAYIGQQAGDGVVGPLTWKKLYIQWKDTLGSPNLEYLVRQ